MAPSQGKIEVFGDLMIEKGETEEGMVHLAKSLYVIDFIDKQKINYGSAEVCNKIGKILYEKGKLKKAGIFFSKAAQIDPDYKEARNNLLILKKILNQDEK